MKTEKLLIKRKDEQEKMILAENRDVFAALISEQDVQRAETKEKKLNRTWFKPVMASCAVVVVSAICLTAVYFGGGFGDMGRKDSVRSGETQMDAAISPEKAIEEHSASTIESTYGIAVNLSEVNERMENLRFKSGSAVKITNEYYMVGIGNEDIAEENNADNAVIARFCVNKNAVGFAAAKVTAEATFLGYPLLYYTENGMIVALLDGGAEKIYIICNAESGLIDFLNLALERNS